MLTRSHIDITVYFDGNIFRILDTLIFSKMPKFFQKSTGLGFVRSRKMKEGQTVENQLLVPLL
jgi:hypothetical protein